METNILESDITNLFKLYSLYLVPVSSSPSAVQWDLVRYAVFGYPLLFPLIVVAFFSLTLLKGYTVSDFMLLM